MGLSVCIGDDSTRTEQQLYLMEFAVKILRYSLGRVTAVDDPQRLDSTANSMLNSDLSCLLARDLNRMSSEILSSSPQSAALALHSQLGTLLRRTGKLPQPLYPSQSCLVTLLLPRF